MGMLKDDYDINIIGRQDYADFPEGSGEITLNTTGSYTHRGGARFIAYKEYDEENPKASYTSVLKVEPGKVTMMRSGSATRLILEQGKRHLCLYDTGYGTMTVGVFTSSLSSSLGEQGGRIDIQYTLDLDSNLSSSNGITVEIKPRRQTGLRI